MEAEYHNKTTNPADTIDPRAAEAFLMRNTAEINVLLSTAP